MGLSYQTDDVLAGTAPAVIPPRRQMPPMRLSWADQQALAKLSMDNMPSDWRLRERIKMGIFHYLMHPGIPDLEAQLKGLHELAELRLVPQFWTRVVDLEISSAKGDKIQIRPFGDEGARMWRVKDGFVTFKRPGEHPTELAVEINRTMHLHVKPDFAQGAKEARILLLDVVATE